LAAEPSAPEPADASLAGLRLALIGAGAVGTAFAEELARCGAEIVIGSRDPERAAALAARIGGRATGASDRALALAGVDGVLLCVVDDALAACAGDLAAAAPATEAPPPILHTSGWHGTEPLAALAERGHALGRLHPLLALPPGDVERPLRGGWFATGGDAPACALARRLVAALGAHELPLAAGPDAAHRYHAGASLLAGGAVALFDLALEVLGPAVASDAAARGGLAALLHSVARNVESLGAEQALTGAVARGSADLVRGHLAALDDEAAAVYRRLARRMLALAARRGTLDDERRAAVERALEE
jgi:predicted short-subunit dehydrogenase-like oxidoreductase (DUF2520 family)